MLVWFCIHNGTVRVWSRQNQQEIIALEVSPDQKKIEEIRQEFLKWPGIFDIKIEALAGTFAPGDDLLFLVVAGDIRENVKAVLAGLLDRVKAGPIKKREIIIVGAPPGGWPSC